MSIDSPVVLLFGLACLIIMWRLVAPERIVSQGENEPAVERANTTRAVRCGLSGSYLMCSDCHRVHCLDCLVATALEGWQGTLDPQFRVGKRLMGGKEKSPAPGAGGA